MRTTRRGVRIAAVVAVLGLVLGACGDDGGSSGGGSGGGEAIKIGALLTLSGPAAGLGQPFEDGINYWLDSFDEIDGRPVEVVVKDDGGTTDGAVTAARELLDREQVDFVIGPFLTGPSTGALPLVNDAEKVQVLMSGYAQARDAGEFPLVFPVEFSAAQTSVDWVQQAEGLTENGQIAYLAPNNEFGHANRDGVAEQAAQLDLELSGEQFHDEGATDLTTEVRNLRDSGADVLIVNEVATAAYRLVIEATESLDWDVDIVGNAVLGEEQATEGISEDVLARLFVTGFTRSILNPLPDDMVEFRDGFTEFLGVDSLDFRLYTPVTAYDALSMLAHAIEEAGSTDSQDIAEYLEANGYEGLKGTYEFSPEEHTGLTADQAALAQAGTFDNGALQVADGSE